MRHRLHTRAATMAREGRKATGDEGAACIGGRPRTHPKTAAGLRPNHGRPKRGHGRDEELQGGGAHGRGQERRVAAGRRLVQQLGKGAREASGRIPGSRAEGGGGASRAGVRSGRGRRGWRGQPETRRGQAAGTGSAAVGLAGEGGGAAAAGGNAWGWSWGVGGTDPPHRHLPGARRGFAGRPSGGGDAGEGGGGGC